ncbi:hypothetical protein Clacol_009770 [Clathrus columnatus]|uniref:Fungal-type protein kinase domain-containing protein n=1 Tax=Clathrus columnatus TaxID=1419009 RepID=A0AAV5ANZ2_9AGAM|nr:hypothetical protein Clacol_009770 [Clathrus columnatus]
MSRQVTPPQGQSGSLAAGSTNTPMSKKQSGFESYSSAQPMSRDERFIEMATEISSYVVGPMPVSEFLDTFLRPKTQPTRQKVPSHTTITKHLKAYLDAGAGSNLKDKYKELPVPYLNLNGCQVEALKTICSDLEVRNTSDNKDQTFHGYRIGPDICVFNRGSSVDIEVTQAEIMIEHKADKNEDPFADESEVSFVKESDRGKRVLGQTTVYATAHQASQFRTHAFSVLVFPADARLFRWDRSGVTVTKAFPINSNEFVEFFQLYNQATPEKRGNDTSVSIPSPENEMKARISLELDANVPLAQLSVGSEAYIVSSQGYMNNAFSPLGRSTRTFTAYSISLQYNVFLKDSWRLDTQTPEHVIYNELLKNGVSHLPTVLVGSDILNQTTLSQDVLGKKPPWLKVQPKPLRKHRHYRISLNEIAKPLSSFSSTKVLVTAILHAIEAHSAAFKAGILHRDISSGNIMIYKDEGLLIDWDLSKRTADEGARGPERTDPTAVQNLTDDVESFIHVLTWVSFRYAGHNMKEGALNHFLTSVFDDAYYEDGLAKGGRMKMNYLMSHSELTETPFDNSILKGLLVNITDKIATRYQGTPSLHKEAKGNLTFLNHLVNAHKETLEELKSSEWIIDEFALALKSPDWPANDGAKKRDIKKAGTRIKAQPSSLKRKSSEDAGGKRKKSQSTTSKK